MGVVGNGFALTDIVCLGGIEVLNEVIEKPPFPDEVACKINFDDGVQASIFVGTKLRIGTGSDSLFVSDGFVGNVEKSVLLKDGVVDEFEVVVRSVVWSGLGVFPGFVALPIELDEGFGVVVVGDGSQEVPIFEEVGLGGEGPLIDDAAGLVDEVGGIETLEQQVTEVSLGLIPVGDLSLAMKGFVSGGWVVGGEYHGDDDGENNECGAELGHEITIANKQAFLSGFQLDMMRWMVKKFIWLLVVGGWLFWSGRVLAFNCGVTVVDGNLTGSGYDSFSINVENFDSSDGIKWFKLENVSGGALMRIVSGSMNGFSTSNVTSTSLEFVGGDLPYYGVEAMTMQMEVPPVEVSGSEGWSLYASESVNGSNPVLCNDGYGTQFQIQVDPASPARPYITNIGVQALGTSATVTWTTDIAATSVVNYGLDSGYGLTGGEANLVTSHSVTLTGLSLDTTYHYKVAGLSAVGGYGESLDGTFRTLAADPAASPTPTVTSAGGSVTATPTPTSVVDQTVIPTATPAPTPTPVPDTAGPVAVLTNVPTEVVQRVGVLEGLATDASRVVLIEYRVDGGGWEQVDTNPVPNTKSARFSFDPGSLTSGEHQIQVKAIDERGNEAVSGVYQVMVDADPPVIEFNSSLAEAYKEAPELRGRVTDGTLVARVEFSTDGGQNWLPVNDGYEPRARQANYSFVPTVGEDGNYAVWVRATDGLGNVVEQSVGELVIDRLPPMVGLGSLTFGPQLLSPDEYGVVRTLAGVQHVLAMTGTGGIVEMKVRIGSKTISMQNIGDLVWKGTFRLDEVGVYPVSVWARDGAGNVTERGFLTIAVVDGGVILDGKRPVAGAVVSLYKYSDLTKGYVLWDAAAFGQQNPQVTNQSGGYGFVLPAGSYYIEVKAAGRRDTLTKIFKLSKSTVVNANIKMKAVKKRKMGPLTFRMPNWLRDEVELGELAEAQEGSTAWLRRWAGKELPEFRFASDQGIVSKGDYRGKRMILSFMSTRLPRTLDQLSNYSSWLTKSKQAMVFMEQDSLAKVRTVRELGDYEVMMVGDVDGELAMKMQLGAGPMHLAVDKNGRVRAVRFGVLDEKELNDLWQETK